MPGGPEPGEQEHPDLNELAETLTGHMFSAQNLTRLARAFSAGGIEKLSVVIGWFIGSLGWIAATFATALVNSENWADGAYKRLAEVAVFDITGENVDMGSGGPGGSSGRRGAHRTVGGAMMNLISGGTFRSAPGAAVEPSLQPASRMIESLVQMSMEGWLQDIIGELVTLGAVEQLGDLDDRLAGALGLSRLARTGLRPIVDATITTPAKWHVNRTYRPELLSVGVAVQQYLRGRMTAPQLEEELARQGYSSERIEALINTNRKFLSPAELSEAIDLGLLEYEATVQHMRDQGYDLDTASLKVRLQQAQHTIRMEDQVIAAAVSAYADRRIDEGEFNRVLFEGGIRGLKLGRAHAIGAVQRALSTRHLSEGQLEDAVKRGILSMVDYRAGLARLGYSPEAAAALELMLNADIRDRDAAAEARRRREEEAAREKAEREAEARRRRAEIEAERAVTEPSVGQMEQAVVRGVIGVDAYAAFLTSEKYDAATIATLTTLVQQDRADYVAAQRKRDEAERRAGVQTPSISQLEAAVVGGYIQPAQYGGILRERGFSAGDAALLVRLVVDRIEELAAARAKREEAERRLAQQEISLGQAEDAVLRGIGTLDQYAAWLQGHGFGDLDRAVLVRLLQSKLADQAAARAKREEAERAARAKGVSLSDLERAVLAGLKPIADYHTALVRAGFELNAAETMVQLLALEQRTQAEARRKRAEAEQRAGERQLSLGDLARAVRLNVIPITAYRAHLDALGYHGADQDVIVETLVREIQATRDAERRRQELEAEADRRQLSIAQIAAAVTRGHKTLAEYGAFLESIGYNADDRALLVQLLEDELAEMARQRRVREAAAAAAQQRGLSLAELERAVTLGLKTMADYTTALERAGFDAEARGTLAALLAHDVQQLAAAARRRAELEAAGDARALTIGQSERAVRDSLRTLDQHHAWLVSQGFTEDDATLLTTLLEHQLAAEAAHQTGGEHA